MDTANPYEPPHTPVATVGKTPKSIMTKLGLILVSLILGIASYIGAFFVGVITTGVLTHKSPYEIVLVFGHFCIPFFICGMVLAVTRGFQYPRILVPSCAFIVIGLLMGPNIEWYALNDLELYFYLSFIAVPLSFAGCVISQALQHRHASNRLDREGNRRAS